MQTKTSVCRERSARHRTGRRRLTAHVQGRTATTSALRDFRVVSASGAISLRRPLFVVVAASAILIAPAIAQSDRDELALYRAGRWFELRTIVTARSPALIRGAVAAAFNDRARAERLLRSVIRSQPSTEAADDAYALLCRTYLNSGLYARFASTYREWGTAFPGSTKYRERRTSFDMFDGRPDQIDSRT